MKRQINKGQQAAEFGILFSVLFLGAIGMLYLFGDNIAEFFNNNSVARTSKNVAGTSINVVSNLYVETPTVTSDETKVDNTIKYNDDGSVSIIVEGTTLNYPKTFVDDVSAFGSDTTFGSFEQATGSSGMELILNELEELIKESKVNNPDLEPSIEIVMGSGTRAFDDLAYVGDAQANSVSIKVNNKLVIIQSDQSCYRNKEYECGYGGVYKIKGEISNGVYNANVKANFNSPKSSLDCGEFTANVDLTDGLKLNDTQTTLGYIYDGEKQKPRNYDWSFDF